MTQAFNLSQLANKVNTSGQLNASTGLYNQTPVANGGTGKSSVTSGSLLVGAGTSAMTELAGSAVDDVVKWDGTAWVSGLSGGSAAPTISVYNAPGTWTLNPAMKGIKVTVVGGGGTGGAAIGRSTPAATGIGGGGGGGGTAVRYLYSPGLPASAITVTAGAGTNSFGAFVSATGGSNGGTGNVGGGAGAAGGIGSSGNLNMRGSAGNSGSLNGAGGASTMGGNGSGAYGGGGNGGVSSTPATVPGAAGAIGVVFVEEFY